jgi:hypothetical protein
MPKRVSEKPVHIYRLFERGDPASRRIYVGATDGHPRYRLASHVVLAHRGGTTPVLSWIRDTIERDSDIDVVIVETVQPLENWQARERWWIAHYRAAEHDVLNVMPGGANTPPNTPQVRAKIAASLRGHVVSPATRAKLRASRLGTKASPETRAKLVAAHIGRTRGPRSDEWRAKLSASVKAFRATHPQPRSDETRAKMSAARRAWWAAKKSKPTTET